jgi:hypothetical protein
MGIKEKFELAEKEIETLVRGRPFANNNGNQKTQNNADSQNETNKGISSNAKNNKDKLDH